MSIGIIDYGVGNLGSVKRAIELAGGETSLIKNPLDAEKYGSLILPGVGNYTECYNKLKQNNWVEFFKKTFDSNRWPLLGICVGMHLLMDKGYEGASAENPTPGLGLIKGVVTNLSDQGCNKRLPHVGWNSINISSNGEVPSIFTGIYNNTDFYFVHSYGVVVEKASMISASVDYGIDIVASVSNKNIFGTQFHPEKSSKAGLALYKNFINIS